MDFTHTKPRGNGFTITDPTGNGAVKNVMRENPMLLPQEGNLTNNKMVKLFESQGRKPIRSINNGEGGLLRGEAL